MLDFHKLEEDVLKYWEKNKIYQKIKKRNAKGKPFYFLQGPPYTSGKIHIGQAWNNSLKDIAMRYKRMQGFDVWDRGGYDMHGLPTEHAVQKKLGLKTKEEIEKYGIDRFVKECWGFANTHAELMSKDLWQLGVWMDHKNSYKPITKEYISGQWAFFRKADEQKRLYKGLKTMHWDAETETSLAKHELEYKTIKDKSVFLKFRKKNAGNEYFIIWTTTPWTIPLNLAIMANPEVDYAKIKVGNEYWIMAKSLVQIFVSGLLGKKYDIIEEFNGEQLEGQEYEHFLNDEMGGVYEKMKKKHPKIHTIILSKQYVDTSSGTGLVHCAPGCGPEDFEVGQENDIPPFNTLNERGEFENSGRYSGWIARADDNKFIEEFDKKNVLIATNEIEHEYPHSDRSKQPVIFRTTEQWFLKTKDLSGELIEMNKKVSWIPRKAGESYDRWAENLRDNGITRQRFWGCPIPIWVNINDPEDYIVLGSIEELEKLTNKKFTDLSVHRPYIDKIEIKKQGKVYKRISDVSDVWIDAGTASWNCLYNNPRLIRKYFPADLVLEATEQTRLWFSLLQICSAVMFSKSAYKNVHVHGMIFDFQGMKMSKSLGNIISPYEVIDKYSVDVLRYYMCQNAAGENFNFSWEDVKVKQRNLMILENISKFIIDLENQSPRKGNAEVEEKWILSRYNSSMKKITELFEQYRLDETITEIEELYITLSRDYIKYIRDKASENSAVLRTIKEVYFGILKMFSAICPFITEHIWQELRRSKLVKEKSVHLCEWPRFNADKINKKTEEEFNLLGFIIEKGLAEREKEQIGLRWPLAKATIFYYKRFDKDLEEVIARQLNVKKIEWRKVEKGDWKIELDFTQTPELEAEGFARELARKVQAERKKRSLQKQDVISLYVRADSELNKMLESQMSFLKNRTNARAVNLADKIILKEIVFSTIKGRKIEFTFKRENI